MDKTQIKEALAELKKNSSKRNFKQSIELIINLKNLNLKKTENQINQFITLHYGTGKKTSICALVGPELLKQAKETYDEIIPVDDFEKFKEKRVIKKLAEKHNFFIAQATIMPKIASTFGKVFGPKGKMPNPKAGCVVPPNANIKPLYERLQKLIHVQSGNQAAIKCRIGLEDQNEEEVIDSAITIYNTVIQSLPNGKHNIKNLKIKLTMSKPVKVGGKKEKGKQKKKDKPSKEKEKPKAETPPKETKEES